jgi:hypothetical protein
VIPSSLPWIRKRIKDAGKRDVRDIVALVEASEAAEGPRKRGSARPRAPKAAGGAVA